MTYDEPIDRFLALAGEMLRSDATREAPVVEGRLRGDITVFPRSRGEVRVGNSALIDYAKYVYYGTMDYATGPVPPRPYTRGNTQKGIRPNKYLDRADL